MTSITLRESMLNKMKVTVTEIGIRDFLDETQAVFECMRAPKDLSDEILKKLAHNIQEVGRYSEILEEVIEYADKEWYESHLDEIADISILIDKYNNRVLKEAIDRNIISVAWEGRSNAQ